MRAPWWMYLGVWAIFLLMFASFATVIIIGLVIVWVVAVLLGIAHLITGEDTHADHDPS